MKKVGNNISGVGDKITTHVTLPLAGVAVAVGHVGMEFESKMSRVKAISGATGEQFKQLEKQALDLGQSTAFSASECADGMENLASAGFTVQETMDAMPGLLDLAASSGEDLATSSNIAASTLRGFGIEASKTSHVADVLAKNAAATNAAVADTGEAMKYVAPNAHAAGLSLEETTAAIGELANAGIMGSQAGTTLRTTLVRLAKPADPAATAMERIGFTAFDSSGKMKSLATIMGELNEKTKNLTDEQKQNTIATIFGTEALSGMTVLMQGGKEGLTDLTNEFKNCDGAAKQMATTMQDNTKASIEQAFGALETAGIKALKAAAPAIKSVADGVGDLADKFSNLSPETQDFIVKAGMVAIAIGPVTSAIGRTVSGVGSLIKVGGKLASGLGLITKGAEIASVATTGMATAVEGTAIATGGATVATAGLGTALTSVALPVAGAVAVIGGLGYATYKVSEKLNESATPAVNLFAGKVTDATKKIKVGNEEVEATVGRTTVKISDSTKAVVQSYMDLDKRASASLMDLRVNSDMFTKDTKDKVIKNFTEMSKKSSNLSDEQRQSMTIDFKKLVNDTGTLTDKNKKEIIKHYSDMVNGTKNLSKQQKDQVIKDFIDTLNKSTAITKKQSTDLQKLYKDMGDKIKQGLDKHRDEDLKSLKDFFVKSNIITTKEEADILKKTTDSWNNKKKTVDDMQDKINRIIQKAADENRQINDKEAKDINEIQQKMKENAVKTLSEGEVESKVILERMKDYDGSITAEEASEHIKKLNEMRDKSVKAANEECDKRIAEIIRMRDESKVISADQADKLIEDAKRQKDETVKVAEETRNQAVDKITSMNSTIKENVDTTTGDVLTNWQKVANWWDSWWPQPKTLSVEETGNSPNPFARRQYGHNWTGDVNFKGGYTTLHEQGWELYDLPEGTRIYNHESSEQMVKESARQTVEMVVGNMMNEFMSLANKSNQQTSPNIKIQSDLHIGTLNEGKPEDIKKLLEENNREIMKKIREENGIY